MPITHADEWKEICKQGECLNSQAQYITSAAVEAALAEIQQEEDIEPERCNDEQNTLREILYRKTG